MSGDTGDPEGTVFVRRGVDPAEPRVLDEEEHTGRQFSPWRFRLVKSGIQITGTPTLQEWVDAVDVVKGMERVAPLALAGLYAYGKSRPEWAEEFYQVTEGYDRRTLENWVSLVRKVTPEIMAKSAQYRTR